LILKLALVNHPSDCLQQSSTLFFKEGFALLALFDNALAIATHSFKK